MKRSVGALVVFAKAPHAGLVKTRMSPPLTPDQAADLYANLLADVLAATAGFAQRLALTPFVAVHPPDACSEIAQRVPPAFRVVSQHGRHLGERMRWAAAEAAAGGARRILLRGSDSPTLDAGRIESALERLDDHDVVLCPDLDGGYSLIGLRVLAPQLFDLPMSTHSVLADTLSEARALGLTTALVDPCFDLDTVGDLEELARARRRGDTRMCPRTLAFLDERSLWERSTPPLAGADGPERDPGGPH